MVKVARSVWVLGVVSVVFVSGCSRDLLTNRNPEEPDAARATQNSYVTPQLSKDEDGNIVFKDTEHRVLTLYGDFLVAQGGYHTGPNEPKKIEAVVPAFLNSGIALSDLACRDWFAYHDTLATRTSYSEGIFDILNALTITSLGLANVSSTAMGAVALLFGGIDSGYANFSANFLLTDSLGKLEKKLIVVREQSARNLETNARTGDYSLSRARAELIKYHDSCSHRQVVQYIKDSVDFAEFSFDGSNLSFDALVKKASLPADLYRDMYSESGSFNEQTLKEFFFVQYGDQQSPTIKKLRETPIIEQLLAKYNALSPVATKEAFSRKLNEFALVNNFRAELEQLMASEAGVIAAEARAKAADALLKKIDGHLTLVEPTVKAATVADTTELSKLKNVGATASAILGGLKSIAIAAPMKSEKVIATKEIADAETALANLAAATGVGAGAAATKTAADAAFKELSEAVDAVAKVMPLVAISPTFISTLETADASAAQMKIDADMLDAPGAPAPDDPAVVAKIGVADGKLNQAMTDLAKANAATGVSVLGGGQSTLPTTFRVSPLGSQ